MEYVASFEQLKRQEELLAVGTHGFDVKPNIFTIFLQHLSQIHATEENLQLVNDATAINKTNVTSPSSIPQRLKHQTQMLLVVEVPEKAQAVELVIGISVIQLFEEFELFQTGLVPWSPKHACCQE